MNILVALLWNHSISEAVHISRERIFPVRSWCPLRFKSFMMAKMTGHIMWYICDTKELRVRLRKDELHGK